MATTATNGLVRIGDFGFTSQNAGGIWCKPENRQAVQIAYDAIDDDNLRDDVLDDVLAAGGICLAASEEPSNG